MTKVADASLNSFASNGMQADFVPPVEDPVLEIPLSEMQGLLDEMVFTYRMMVELLQDVGILRGRELAKTTDAHLTAVRAEKSPITKILLLNAYIRQHLNRIRDALKCRPAEGGKVVQVCSKIMARAVQIIEFIKAYGEDDPNGSKRDVGLDSQQARLLFSGAGGEPVSRKETIRAMRRAEKLWPALRCGHRPHDGRQTMRLTIKRTDLGMSPEFGYRDIWQRSGKALSFSL